MADDILTTEQALGAGLDGWIIEAREHVPFDMDRGALGLATLETALPVPPLPASGVKLGAADVSSLSDYTDATCHALDVDCLFDLDMELHALRLGNVAWLDAFVVDVGDPEGLVVFPFGKPCVEVAFGIDRAVLVLRASESPTVVRMGDTAVAIRKVPESRDHAFDVARMVAPIRLSPRPSGPGIDELLLDSDDGPLTRFLRRRSEPAGQWGRACVAGTLCRLGGPAISLTPDVARAWCARAITVTERMITEVETFQAQPAGERDSSWELAFVEALVSRDEIEGVREVLREQDGDVLEGLHALDSLLSELDRGASIWIDSMDRCLAAATNDRLLRTMDALEVRGEWSRLRAPWWLVPTLWAP